MYYTLISKSRITLFMHCILQTQNISMVISMVYVIFYLFYNIINATISYTLLINDVWYHASVWFFNFIIISKLL